LYALDPGKAIYGKKERKKELRPIKLQLNHFFSILAGIIWIIFFINWISNRFTDRFGDLIMRICVSGGIINIVMMAFLFLLRRFLKWSPMNPLKMHPLDCLSTGVIGVVQFFPLAYMIGTLWQKILLSLQYILNIDCVEQPILVLLRKGLTCERQFLGIIFLTVVLAPIAEEIFFRYFFYRFWKLHMSSQRAMLLAAFVFALLHFNLAAFVPLWVMGIFLTFLYERYGNLVPCILVHSLFNYISILVMVLFS
jgi:membrane protease YdiL (CAAX protease family)